MANSIAISATYPGIGQLQGYCNEVIAYKATISDQDAVSANDSVTFSFTAAGAALGDLILAWSIDVELSSGNHVVGTVQVTAANTIVFRIQCEGSGAFTADTLNSAILRVVIGKPSF